ncbi:MAG: MiaB/RimO family radical SAM methylthiotransferase, partial [Verrucomicrobia bacterium]|nr:MiaB/RimO family radical SAM methylthiotransferase [Verrucomicrobiota bacterium]
KSGVNIMYGCNNFCTYCIVPYVRGREISRKPEDILAEARASIKNGCREINLISQDTSWYGQDLIRRKKLESEMNPAAYLLKKVSALRGDFWVRLLYTHPAHWTDELIEVMAKSRKAVKYVDIPLQHIHPVMLERMGRRTPEKQIRALLDKIRERIPGVTIRTTFIVGFPGETEEYFQSLMDFVKEQRFQKVGAFTYSAQEGTRAAVMTGTVPEAVKRKRLERLMRLQRDISLEQQRAMIGKTLKVLVERPITENEIEGVEVANGESGRTRGSMGRLLSLDTSYWVARGAGDAPDVDGRVYVRNVPEEKAGDFLEVKVTDCREYDLLAEPAALPKQKHQA